MESWRNETVDDNTPLHDYYRVLDDCEWAVWRAGNPNIPRKHLRIMQRVRGGDEIVSLAVHIQVVEDEA